MEITFLRARRIALASLLKAEKRRQQGREAEARFYADEICPTSGAVDGGEASDLQAESTPEMNPAPEVLSQPAHHH